MSAIDQIESTNLAVRLYDEIKGKLSKFGFAAIDDIVEAYELAQLAVNEQRKALAKSRLDNEADTKRIATLVVESSTHARHARELQEKYDAEKRRADTLSLVASVAHSVASVYHKLVNDPILAGLPDIAQLRDLADKMNTALKEIRK